MKRLILVLSVFLIILAGAKAYEPLVVPPVGAIKCVDPAGCDLPASNYQVPSGYGGSSLVSSGASSSSSSGSGISALMDHPCVQAALSYCYQYCRAYKDSVAIKSCILQCVKFNPNARKVFIKCAQVVPSTTSSAVSQAPSAFRKPLAKKPVPEENFDFVVLVSDASVNAGSIVKVPVNVKRIKGKSQIVSLAIGGSGIFDLVQNRRTWYSFTKESVMPTDTATLSISTTKNSVPGDYHLAVRGLGGNERKSGEFTLRINPAPGPVPKKTALSNPYSNPYKVTK